MLEEKYIDKTFASFSATLESLGSPIPAVSLIALEDNAPYRILVSTILSLRTRDRVTYDTSMRLLKIAPTLDKLAVLDEETIVEAIKPSGFYTRKAKQLKEIAAILMEKYQGEVPDDMDALMALPGVGIKTASLVLNLGFQVDAVCVDCHVHQISNRLGWVDTKTPEETEKALRENLPKRFWIPINELFVRYGQFVCLPLSPKCSLCPLNNSCPKNGVEKTR
ncbi:MAG: endonuclease III [Spirochaetales bacterium]|nr:endonuclease III [Candidatus Physcosoma equi]